MKLAPIAVLALLLLSFPAVAQERSFDLTGAVVWTDPTSEGTFNEDDPTDVDFDGSVGYGIAANVFWSNRISTEFAISRTTPEAQVRRRAVGGTGGDLEMMPITAVLQFHFAPNGAIDPYVGAGVAYVLLGDLPNTGTGVNRIDFEDDYGFAINGGLGIRLGDRLGITLDAKYVPVESAATAVFLVGPNAESNFDISPVILSAGLTLRF